VQQDLAVDWQQELVVDTNFSRVAAAKTYCGGVTPCWAAQASFSTLVKQQQLRQQASALAQPQG
jgi:hypothetical protein